VLLGMFSAAAITPTTRIGSLSSAQARSAPITAAAPDMSCFISSIAADGLIETPPESKVIPLPTRQTVGSFRADPAGCLAPFLPRLDCGL
jgi:hypothetical protein